MNTTVKEVKQNKKAPHVNLKAALADLDILIEHFSHPDYPNQSQAQVMRRIRQQVLAAVEQLKKSGVGA